MERDKILNWLGFDGKSVAYDKLSEGVILTWDSDTELYLLNTRLLYDEGFISELNSIIDEGRNEGVECRKLAGRLQIDLEGLLMFYDHFTRFCGHFDNDQPYEITKDFLKSYAGGCMWNIVYQELETFEGQLKAHPGVLVGVGADNSIGDSQR